MYRSCTTQYTLYITHLMYNTLHTVHYVLITCTTQYTLYSMYRSHVTEGVALRYATANSEDNARADIRAGGFWGVQHQSAFFDIKVFNHSAQLNKKFSIPSCYKHHERIKRRGYEQRIIEIEQGSFTPVIFSTSGGMGKSAEIFYKCLASMIAEKRRQSYQSVIQWMRCLLNFSLIRSAIMCLRGSRYRYSTRLPDCFNRTVIVSKLHH